MGRYTNHCNLLCAVAIPAGEAAEKLPFGITLFGLAENEGLISGAAELYLSLSGKAKQTFDQETVLVAVCGLHMRGFLLEKQMAECRGKFVEEAVTAPKDKMVKLPTEPAKPGLIKTATGGGAVQFEIWEMPLLQFGRFSAAIPSPLWD